MIMSGSSFEKSNETQRRLRRNIIRAVTYLEQNITDNPSVDELAKMAGMSKFHFLRVFKSIIGETPNQHVRRLRIERAASMLKSSNWLAGDIAIACGFKTQANFARDFTKYYGTSPQQYRSDNNCTPFLRGHFRSRPERELGDPNLLMPTVSISDWPDLDIITFRYYGAVEKVPFAWAELLEWAKKGIPDIENARFFGLWFDEWTSQEPSEANYRYECAILPSKPICEGIPAPFTIRTLDGGTIASSQVKGSLNQLDQHWKNFGMGWLPFSGYQPRGEIVGIDEYAANVALAPLAQKALMLLAGVSLTMHIPVQKEPVVL